MTRVVDRQMWKLAALLATEGCAACGGRPASVHHVVQKGSPHFGDDRVENAVVLCGTGSSGCHGAFHGNPYDHTSSVPGHPDRTVRRDADWVGARIGAHLVRHRPDVIQYVYDKLGAEPAAEYLRRFYHLDLSRPLDTCVVPE